MTRELPELAGSFACCRIGALPQLINVLRPRCHSWHAVAILSTYDEWRADVRHPRSH
jgi:hypothetical protein